MSARLTLAALTALSLAGCAGLGAGPGGTDDVARDAGSNLVGESCTVTSVAASGEIERKYSVQCGSWQQPSARVVTLRGASGPVDALSGGRWRAEVDSRLSCDGARPTEFGGGLSGAIATCRLRNGGFPMIAVAFTGDDGRTVLADGIPAALPVIERVALADLGRTDLGGETADSRALALVAQSTGVALTGADAIDGYFRAIATAQYRDTIQDFAAAEEAYRAALLAQTQALGSDHPASAYPLMHVALELSNQGRYAEAAPLFDEAQRLAAASPNPGDLPRLFSYRAIDAANRNKLDVALTFAEKATAARRKIVADQGGGVPRGDGLADLVSFGGGSVTAIETDIAQGLHTEAALRLRLGDLAGAADRADEAIETVIASRVAPPWWQPQFLETKASIASAGGNRASAVAYQGEAVNIWARILPASTPEGAAHLGLGHFLHLKGDDGAAIEAYRQGFAILKARNAEIRPRDLIGFLDTAVAIAVAQPDKADLLHVEMFEAMQLMRSGVTSRTVSLATARLAAGEDTVGKVIRAQQDNERKRYTLVARLNQALSVPPEASDGARIAELRASLEETEAEGRRLDETLQAASSGYRQLLATPVGARELQELLQPREAIVAFASAENATYGFLVTADKLKVWRIDAGDLALGDVVVSLRRGISPVKGKQPAFPVDLAHQLYGALFGPIAEDLAGIDRLVTTANGALASIPFGVLVASAPPAGADYGAVDWMMRHQALAAVPSVRSFADLRKVPTAAAGSTAMIGFGDYRPPQDMAALFANLPQGCARDAKALASLGPLPATARELA